MTETYVDEKDHDEYFEDSRYKIGDIVELRNPKGILGVIKYIGAKKNRNGNHISKETHYVIQLEEYLGNGNGAWNGYQYIDTLRPDKTMQLCKYNNIRCKRGSDDVLKALYNILRSHSKYKKQIKRQQSYINELEDINYKLQQRLQSQTYYFISSKVRRNSIPHIENPLDFEVKAASPLHTRNASHNTTESMISNLTIVPTIPQSTSNMNINEARQHQISSSIPHMQHSASVTGMKTSFTNSMHRMDRIENITRTRSDDNGTFSRSEKWVTLSTNNNNNNNMITPPPNTVNNGSMSMDIVQKMRRSHRRNESEDFDQHKMNAIQHQRHQSTTFAIDGVVNMSQITELTQNESELTKNNMNKENVEITPAPEIEETQLQNSMDSVSIKQKRNDIKKGGNMDTIGKIQLKNRELKRQQSMERIMEANIVNNKVDVFERMIKTNTERNERKPKEIENDDDIAHSVD